MMPLHRVMSTLPLNTAQAATVAKRFGRVLLFLSGDIMRQWPRQLRRWPLSMPSRPGNALIHSFATPGAEKATTPGGCLDLDRFVDLIFRVPLSRRERRRLPDLGLTFFTPLLGCISCRLRMVGVDFLLNHFAPCAEAEFCRVLRPGGVLVVGAAGADHLLGMKRAVYDTPVYNEPRADLPVNMPLLERRTVRADIRIESRDDIAALFAMTPYYYRTSEAGRARLAALDTLETEIVVELFVYRRPERIV